MNQKKPRHHGNLREALINAGLDIVNEGGPDALTLRKCAARAGVSHAAPAHHFKGLISLKAAIIARGHGLFADTMRAASAKADPNPHAQLVAICHGYVTFSKTHSALFQFMFQPHDVSPDEIDSVTLEELARETEGSYGILRAACAPFEHPSGDPLGTETMIWSLVHGYAMLFGGKSEPSHAGGAIPDIEEIIPPLTLRRDG